MTDNRDDNKKQQPELDDDVNVDDESQAVDDVDLPADDGADPLQSLRAERDALEEKWLRVHADYQNFVRRSEQNLIHAREQQVMEMAKALVTVMDHFDNALNVDPEKTNTQDVLTGVQIVRDELMNTLQRFGVQRIDAKNGEPFDPNRHEALMRQEQEGVDSDHVVSQLQPGYMLGDKTVRPAKVSVAP